MTNRVPSGFSPIGGDTHIEAAAIGQPEGETRIVVNERIDDGRKLGYGIVTHQRSRFVSPSRSPGSRSCAEGLARSTIHWADVRTTINLPATEELKLLRNNSSLS